MSLSFIGDNLELIYRDLMHALVLNPEYESAPRGKPIREHLFASFTLTDPRNRLITSPARNVNYGFAVGELCWYVRGDYDLETMLYYNKRMAQFSDDGKTINSAYGARMFNGNYNTGTGSMDPRTQFDLVIEELKNDPDSRRAVMHINQPRDLLRAVSRGSKDVPCTMSLQLLIRDRRLHMHVLMRSNDVVWGLPYDVFSFTCLQEAFLYMLQDAGVQVDGLGVYRHTAGSLHVYDTHFAMAGEAAKETHDPPSQMKPFTLDELNLLANEWEPRIRRSAVGDYGSVPSVAEGRAVGWMADRLIEHRLKRHAEAEERARKGPILTELVRATEDVGGYRTEDKVVEPT